MPSIRIGLSGVAGKMGKTLTQLIHESDDLVLCGGVESEGSPDCGKDVGTVVGMGEIGVLVEHDISTALASADIWVDFSVAHVTPPLAEACAFSGKGLVIGTTGIDEAGMVTIRKAAESIPIVMAPNMSVGVNMTFKLIELAAESFGQDTDVEISETHHKHKVDAPSGTAVRIGELIAGTRGKTLREVAVFGREGITGERIPGSIGMHSARGGDVVGDHTATFFLEGERLEITHRSQSRLSFAFGALRAARFVSTKISVQETGLYGMDHVLGFT